MRRIIERAGELGMVVILGYSYFGPDQRLSDEAAVTAAVENATELLVAGGYRKVIVEIANEIDVPRYAHQILKPDHCHELIELVQRLSAGRVASRTGRLLGRVRNAAFRACPWTGVPVDWRINAPRNCALFNLLAELTGSEARW